MHSPQSHFHPEEGHTVMIIKKSAVNSISCPPNLTGSSKFGKMSNLSILGLTLGSEFNSKKKDSEKGWASTYKVQSSHKIFEKNSAVLKQGSSGQVNRVFGLMRFVLLALGRFPFSPTVRAKGLSSPTFPYTFKTIHWAYFTITSVYLGTVLILLSHGFANFFLTSDEPSKSQLHENDKAVFKKNLVPFVLFWGCLVHLAIGNFVFYKNRKKTVDYLNNWNMVIDIISIDLPATLGKYLLFANVWIITFVAMYIIFYAFNLAPIARGFTIVVTHLSLRPFLPDAHFSHDITPSCVFGLFTILYGIYGSRAMLFVYLFKSRLLRYSFRAWNQRLRDQLFSDRNDSNTYTEKIECEKLYRDHYILVRMVRETDSVFGTMLQSYYGTQILNMCFELYYLARSGLFCSDTSDILVAAMLLAQTVSFVFTVSLDAAYVGEEAMRGFEVIRSCGLRSDDSIHKKHLIYSLEMSFAQRIVLTGGKFFSVDRPFIVTVFGAVFTYFVIILQFGIGTQIDEACKDNVSPTPLPGNVSDLIQLP